MKTKQTMTTAVSRLVLHCDMDNYFASVEEKFNPMLCTVPFAVCGDPAMRHSIVMAKNMLAKQMGIITGIPYVQAKQICPGLHYIKADHAKYLSQTKLIRTIFSKYSDSVVPYGMDEAWINLQNKSYDDAIQIAELIRVELKYSLGLSVSIGLSDNYIFSKLGSDFNKPGGFTVITHDNFQEIIWPLPASNLLFVGKKREQILRAAGFSTIGDIARSDCDIMMRLLGKAGFDLWFYAHGDDRSFKPNTEAIGSIGNTITLPKDLTCNQDVEAVLFLLATTVCSRLKKHGLYAGTIGIGVRDCAFNKTNRQLTLACATDKASTVFMTARDLFIRHYSWERPLRSIGIRTDKLTGMCQMTLTDVFGKETENRTMHDLAHHHTDTDEAEYSHMTLPYMRTLDDLKVRIGPIQIEPSIVH